jgi:hypothetical protein
METEPHLDTLELLLSLAHDWETTYPENRSGRGDKERGMSKPKLRTTGVMVVDAKDMSDDTGTTLALIRYNRDRTASINWNSELFNPKSPAFLPSSIRDLLVLLLREHADCIESHEMDAAVQKAMQKLMEES